MLRKRSVSLVSCKYEAVIESAWKQTKVRVWVKKLWSWTLKADRQQAARSALCRLPKLCRQCAVATSPLHSGSSFFLFFSGCLVSPARLSWPSIGSCRLTALSRDSELSAWYSYDDLRCKTIPNHRSLLPRLQNRILLYHILYSRTQFQVPSLYSEGNAGLLFCLALYSVIACQNISLSSGLAHWLISIQLLDRCKQAGFYNSLICTLVSNS